MMFFNLALAQSVTLTSPTPDVLDPLDSSPIPLLQVEPVLQIADNGRVELQSLVLKRVPDHRSAGLHGQLLYEGATGFDATLEVLEADPAGGTRLARRFRLEDVFVGSWGLDVQDGAMLEAVALHPLKFEMCSFSYPGPDVACAGWDFERNEPW